MVRFVRSVFSFERSLGITLLAAILAIYYANPRPGEFLRLKTFDFYQTLQPRKSKELPIPVPIIDVDEASLEKYGQWPWPRTLLGQLTDRLRESGVGVIGFDVFFPEYDRMSPALVAENLHGLDDNLATQLKALPTTESVLANSLRKIRVVLGQGTVSYTHLTLPTNREV